MKRQSRKAAATAGAAAKVCVADIKRFSEPAEFRRGLMIQAGASVSSFADVMADFQRADFENLDSGFRALASGEKPILRRFWIERTKGGSKDTDLTVMMLWLLMYSRRPLRVQIAAYDAGQADEVRLIAKQLLSLDGVVNRLLGEFLTVRSDGFLCERTGSFAEILTTDSLGSHGARPDVVLLNELSHIRDREFAQTVLDNADKVPSCIVVIATNAGCIDSWQYEWREIARTMRHRWCFSALDRPAPWVTAADLEESRRRNPPSRFDRLWGGKWVRGSGDALDLQIIEQSVVLDGPQKKGDPNCVYAAGLDIGIRRDHSACVVVGYNRIRERFFVAECLSWTPTKGVEVEVEVIENAILQLHSRFNFRLCGYDPSQAIYLAQRLNRRGVRMEEMPFVGRNLHTMAETLIELFNTRAIDLYDDPALVRDLGRLSIAEKPYGFRLDSVADATGHADRATAMSICLPLLRSIVKNVGHAPKSGVVAMRVVSDPVRHGVQLFRERSIWREHRGNLPSQFGDEEEIA